jgi:hypothetical protein
LASIVEILRAYRRRRLADICAAGAAWLDHVLTNGLGAPIRPDTASRSWSKPMKAHNDQQDSYERLAHPQSHARLHDPRAAPATSFTV